MDSKRVMARRSVYNWRFYNSHFIENNLKHYQPPPSYGMPSQNVYAITTNSTPNSRINSNQQRSYFQRCNDIFADYCDTSSIHGLRYIGNRKINAAERFFWMIAVFVAICMAIYFISNLYINYDANPVIVSFSPQKVNVEEIPFPAITICNLNVALKRRAERVNINGTFVEQRILSDLCDKNISSVRYNTGAENVPISWQTIQKTIRSVTQKCREMVVACKWQNKQVQCPEVINPVFTDDGFCCSFNKLPLNYALRKHEPDDMTLNFPNEVLNWNIEEGYPTHTHEDIYPYRGFGRGVNQGLTLVLDANLDEYYCSTTSSVGFKALMATPRDSPKMKDLGFLIPSGVETRISINVRVEDASDSIRDIDYRKRKCFFATERYLKFYKLYSARSCLLECEANYTIKVCGCATFDMPRDITSKICNKDDEECVNSARFHIERFGHDKSACNCLPGCFEIAYLPGAMTFGQLENDTNIIEPFYLGNFTPAYFRRNMAVAHFFYTFDKFEKQTKSALYGFPEFLSSTGGLLGLFLGFSFLSIIEIIYYIFMKKLCKGIRSKTRNIKRILM